MYDGVVGANVIMMEDYTLFLRTYWRLEGTCAFGKMIGPSLFSD